MSERVWTKEQENAIYTKWRTDGSSCNILVNAAAGSGKTAVLVERIIKKLIGENQKPVDIDRLLVVTFTNAAATEMKDRISSALSEKIEKAAESGDIITENLLKHQMSLLYNADITTIDAFCMKMIRENFHLLGIDPSFGIADNAQLSLLADEAMEEMFDECYENENEDFLLLADMYSDGRDDSALAEIITEIYDFIRALPNPYSWLEEKAEMYLLSDSQTNPWFCSLFKKKNILCKKACKKLEKAILYMADYISLGIDNADKIISLYPGGEENDMQLSWGSCYEIIFYEYIAAKNALNANWDDAADVLSNIIFKRWGTASAVRCREKEINDKDAKVYIKELRDASKDNLQQAADFVFAPAEEISQHLKEEVYPAAKALSNLVKMYNIYFYEKKQKKNVLDFSDIEHLCLRLFNENEEVCSILKDKYEEILMDEYQDSNGLQEEIFRKISRGDNMFMVGDMKQSIYRFRRSDPMIFKEKSNRFETYENAPDKKIILSKNFRSRAEVLNSVNAVFEKIMSEYIGDINYNEEQKLYYNENNDFENINISNNGYTSECWVLSSQPEDDDSESIEKAEIEATFIAKRIAELKKTGYAVFEKGKARPIKNRDITILMSSCKNVADIYISALNREGIECFAESSGYFDRNEVKIIMSLIRIIQNPRQDIPMIAILRSPIGRFSDDELVQIRMLNTGCIFECLKKYSDTSVKAAEFLNSLNRWRSYTKYMSCARLIWTLYEETGIYAFVGALYDGAEAQANLRLLFERAKKYETSGYKGLFHFSEYIKKLEQHEEDLPTAKLIGEENDVVRIMTIHKSKGLEFPVVFLAGCGKEFLTRQKKIPIHKDLGIGLDNINTEKNYRYPTIAKKAVSNKNVLESISEEERKLYVALTRAKEKLIVTGVINCEHLEEREMYWDKILSFDNSVINPDDVSNAKGFMDWIAPVARKSSDWFYETVPYTPYFPEITDKSEIEDIMETDFHVEKFIYPYEFLKKVPAKVSVTDLKNNSDFSSLKNDTELMPRPDFLSEKVLTPAQKGSALHLVMQNTIPSENIDEIYVKNLIDKLVSANVLSEKEAENVNAEKIIKFYKTPLGTRISASNKVVREAPFETEIPLSLFEGYESVKENILLQGVVDCWFEEDNEIVIVDYKTDYYKHVNEIIEKYNQQLKWYAYALEHITHKNVKNMYIYAFSGDKIIEIKK